LVLESEGGLIRPSANSLLWADRSGFNRRMSLQTGCVAEHVVRSRLGAVSDWSGDGAKSELDWHTGSQLGAVRMQRSVTARQPVPSGL